MGTGFSRVIESEGAKRTQKARNQPMRKSFIRSIVIWNRWASSSNDFCPNTSSGTCQSISRARVMAVSHRQTRPPAPGKAWSRIEWRDRDFASTRMGAATETDYDVLRSIDTFCSMALVAAFHGRSRVFKGHVSVESMRPQIEAFASRIVARPRRPVWPMKRRSCAASSTRPPISWVFRSRSWR